LALLRTCDGVILNMLGPALLPSLDRPAIALLTGSDLEFLANATTELKWSQHPFLRAVLARVISHQREGIRRAKAVSFFWRGISPPGDRILDRLGISDERRFFVPMSDLDLIHPSPLPSNSLPRMFCVAKMYWNKAWR